MALTAYEDGLCPGCGQPRDRAWNEDMEGHYETHRTMCHACQAKHLYDDAHGAPGAAEHQYVRDIAPVGYSPDPRMAADS